MNECKPVVGEAFHQTDHLMSYNFDNGKFVGLLLRHVYSDLPVVINISLRKLSNCATFHSSWASSGTNNIFILLTIVQQTLHYPTTCLTTFTIVILTFIRCIHVVQPISVPIN